MYNYLNTRSPLCFNNGIYDFAKGEFLTDKLKYVNVNYTYNTNIDYCNYENGWENAVVKDVMEFIENILPDKDERDYTLKLLSSFMDGNKKNNKIHLFVGNGSNGKSALLQLFTTTMGDYSGYLPIFTLTTPTVKHSNLVQNYLQPRRFAVCQDIPYYSNINGIQLEKMLSKVPILLETNYLPKITSDNYNIWNNIRCIEFKSTFMETIDKTFDWKYIKERDEHLMQRIESWKTPFMWILQQYYKKWLKEGLVEPHSVMEISTSYRDTYSKIYTFTNDYIKPCNDNFPLTLNEIWYKYKYVFDYDTTTTKKQLKTFLEDKWGEQVSVNNIYGWRGYCLNTIV